MTSISSVIEEFPENLQVPVKHLYEILKVEGWVSHDDFSDLKGIVSGLAVSQQELTEAQNRTENSLEELIVTQNRIESHIGDLVDAQNRTENRVEELTIAQNRTENRMEELVHTMERGFKSVRDSISALGSRWGIMSEETFRKAVRGILEETGYKVDRGWYGGREVDVVIQNGSRIILELTSALRADDIPKIIASAEDYEQRSGTTVSIMVAAIFIPPMAMRALLDAPRKIALFTYEGE